jgi:hypothetical protein
MRIEPGQPSLFKRNDVRIAVLSLGAGKARSHQFTYGIDAVCDELSVNVAATVTPETVADCDIALCSLCSPQDTLALACALDRRPQSRLIVGGQGVYPFRAWRHLTHRIAFGRVEDAVDDCVLGDAPLPWCYDYDTDPDLSGRYTIRQARRLLKGEASVGCNGACKFCQYRATRRRLHTADKGFHAGSFGYAPTEDRWEALQVKTGQNMTALDGLSEETRRRVSKPVDDEQIVDKLNWCLDRLQGIMRLKVFQIVGYPWETPESVREDVLRLRDVLSRVRPSLRGGRIMMLVTVTPFSPEPLTPMEDEPANITDNWRDILLHDDLRCIFDSPHLNAFFLPQIPGALTLYKRVAVNRGATIGQLRGIAAAKTIEDAVAIGGDLHAAGAGLRVSDVLAVEKMPNARSHFPSDSEVK